MNEHSLRQRGCHYWLGECAPCGCKAAEETKSLSVLRYPDLFSSLHAYSHCELYRSVDWALTRTQKMPLYKRYPTSVYRIVHALIGTHPYDHNNIGHWCAL